MVHSGSTVVGAERAPSIARSTAVTAPREPVSARTASRSVRTSARRPGDTTRSAAVSVSPSARWLAISRGFRPCEEKPELPGRRGVS